MAIERDAQQNTIERAQKASVRYTSNVIHLSNAIASSATITTTVTS